MQSWWEKWWWRALATEVSGLIIVNLILAIGLAATYGGKSSLDISTITFGPVEDYELAEALFAAFLMPIWMGFEGVKLLSLIHI